MDDHDEAAATMGCTVLGATGLVGRSLLTLLTEPPNPRPVRAWVRRPPVPPLPAAVELRMADLSAGEAVDFLGVTAFCALGTTMRQAGSKQAFAAVDRDLVVSLAHAALAQGVSTFVVVTAAGSDRTSAVFYNRVKGEAEQQLRALGFQRLAVLRPSLLLGPRQSRRPGEAVAQALMGPLRALTPAAWRAVPARSVAQAMLRVVADTGWEGVRVVDNAEIHRLAGG